MQKENRMGVAPVPGLIVSDPAALGERHFRAMGAEPGLPVAALPCEGPLLANMRAAGLLET